MKVKFSKPKAVVQGDINAFAQAIGHTVSSELERFFLNLTVPNLKRISSRWVRIMSQVLMS